MKYDYLVVGSGLFGAIFAHEATKKGKKVLVVDKRSNIAGNIYTKEVEGINVHEYGAHIFHTNNKKVWQYVNQFAEFNRFTNSPVANYKGELYSLPFNMYTFNKMWGVVTPEEATKKIEEQRKEITHEPTNLEEQAISLVGRDIYEKLIKGYTEKHRHHPVYRQDQDPDGGHLHRGHPRQLRHCSRIVHHHDHPDRHLPAGFQQAQRRQGHQPLNDFPRSPFITGFPNWAALQQPGTKREADAPVWGVCLSFCLLGCGGRRLCWEGVRQTKIYLTFP